MKTIAVIADIHGNLEALQSILEDISNKSVEEVVCLGDTIDIGPNSRECIDLLIDNNIKMVLGNHELYLLRGTDIEPSIIGEEKQHYQWVKSQLTAKEIDYIRSCPLSYEYSADDGRLIFCHYLFDDASIAMPFEKTKLDQSSLLWTKYCKDNIHYFIGHLHYDIKEVPPSNNVTVVKSAGCTQDEYTSYLIINIDKTISAKKITVKYDRQLFLDKVLSSDFPDKKNICQWFYGITI